MNKLIACILLLLASTQFSYAGYFEVNGAEMSYKYLGNRYYEIKLNVYTRCPDNPGDSLNIRISSPTGTINPYIIKGKALDLGEVTLDCGYGSNQICHATDSFSFSARKWTVSVVVQLSKSACEYTFSWSAPRRSFYITTGAVLEPFYIESYINICDQDDISSPEFIVKPYFLNPEETCLTVPNTFYDNSKTANANYFAELVPPLTGKGSPVYYHSPNSYLEPVTTYNMGQPDDTANCSGFYCNPSTGALHFKATKLFETTPVAIRISKYINKKLVSQVTRDFNISTQLIKDNHDPLIEPPNHQRLFEVNAGSQFNLRINTFDIDNGDSVRISESDSMTGSSFYVVDKTKEWQSGIFSWKPGIQDVRERPYAINLYASDNVGNCENVSTTGKAEKIIYVSVVNKKSNISPVDSFDKLKLYPIPARDLLSIEGLKEKPKEVIVNDITGKAMSVNIEWDGARLYINTSQLAKGQYLIRFITNSNSACRSFIRE